MPTLGRSNPILSYRDAWCFVAHGKELLEEGYAKVSRPIEQAVRQIFDWITALV